MTVARTQGERYADAMHTIDDQTAEIAALKKVLSSVLNTIEGMRPSPGELDEIHSQFEDEGEDSDDLDESGLFGGFDIYGITNIDGPDMSRPVVIDWPDLDLAAKDIRKVLT